jgi:hypothetical protein
MDRCLSALGKEAARMSEYQYYEFLALDRALTEKQRAELRSLSTRAEITATRFVNEYHWGDFKGDPRMMMERYFDAFLYLANWGTRHVMFRVPRETLDEGTAALYCGTDAASFFRTEDHLVVSLYADREPDDYWREPQGELAGMVQARSELAAGDLRLLYLGWLLAVQSDEVDGDDAEPPVPAGLSDLSAPLRAVADFLDIDQDLLAVAAEVSPNAAQADHGGLAEWVASLPFLEKDALLQRVVSGEGAAVRSSLLRRWRGVSGGNEAVTSTRTVADLWEAAADRKEARLNAEEKRRREKQAREAAAKAVEYASHLDKLAARQEAAWERTGELIETRNPRDFDFAVTLLCDLSALAERQGETAVFTRRFLALRKQHERKSSLQERFDKAGLPRLS